MKGFIIKQLEKAQKEVNKRLSIKESYGLDMANYENSFSEIFTDMLIEYFKYVGCVDDHSSQYSSLKDQIEYWLWERNYEVMYKKQPMWIESEKRSFKGTESPIGYVVNTEDPRVFYDYIINTYYKGKDERKATYTLKEVRQLLEDQKNSTVFSLSLRSEGFVLPRDLNKVSDILLSSPLIL